MIIFLFLKYSLSRKNVSIRAEAFRPIQFYDDCVSETAFAATANPAENSIILLENTRFHLEEEGVKGFGDVSNLNFTLFLHGIFTFQKRADPDAIERFSAALARHGDIYVNDAFDLAHRAFRLATFFFKTNCRFARSFSSLTTIPIYPKYCGLLVQRELSTLTQILGSPARPYLVVFGGAKSAEKTLMVEHILEHCDELIIGGGMAFTFLKVQQDMQIGDSLFDEENVQVVKNIFEKSKRKNVQVKGANLSSCAKSQFSDPFACRFFGCRSAKQRLLHCERDCRRRHQVAVARP